MRTESKFLYVMLLSIGLGACANNPQVAKQSINVKAQETLKKSAQTAKKQAMALPKDISDELFEPSKLAPAKSLAKKIEPRFDLVVTKAPVSQVLMGIVSGTAYSMVLHPDIAGEISVNLKDVTLFEALNSLRELYGLEYKMQGKQIYVEAQTLQTRVFQINYISGKRSGGSGLNVTSGSRNTGQNNIGGALGAGGQGVGAGLATNSNGSQESFASSVQTKSDTDFWSDIEASLDSMIGKAGGRNVVVNKQSGLVIVRAMPKEIRQIEKFLSLMQITVDRQVILEAKILKVALNKGSEQGINWAMFRRTGSSDVAIGNVNGNDTLLSTTGSIRSGELSSNLSNLANTGATAIGNSMFAIAMQGAKFSALLSFLETQGDVEVLSSPRIATINNQKAVLKVGVDQFFVTRVSAQPNNSATTASAIPSIETQQFFSGISLDVTPQIDKDDNITLHIHPLVSDVSQVKIDVDAFGSRFNFPTAATSISETDSIVRTRDGNVIAIGGLMTESVNQTRSKVPGLGDVKWVGNLFRQKVETSKKSELVILLKSTVVRSGDNWAQDMLDTQERIEKLKGEDF